MKLVTDIQKIYFIGIGGIGMSAIARYMNAIGKDVYGYDKTKTVLTENLEKEGMSIHYEDNVDLIPEGIDIVVYTPAIPDSHRELTFFRANGFDVIKRSQMLGILSETNETIAIAGTHGKTSTSSMTTYFMKEGGIDVNAFVGGIMSNYGTNYVQGKENKVIVEADEYDRSFLTLRPDFAAIISMDADHLDIYGGQEAMIESFNLFAQRMKPDGTLLVHEDIIGNLSTDTIEFAERQNIKILSFGGQDADVSVTNIRVEEGTFLFDYQYGNHDFKNLKFALPGRHNVMNASIAVTFALMQGVEESALRQSMQSFRGIKRRFEKIHEGKVVYFDDYAHHPTELKAAIGTARMLFPDKKLTGVFQPHLFSRTRDFVDGFAEALDLLDECYLLDIYPARELPIEGVTSAIIFDKMKSNHKVMTTREALVELLRENELEILLTLGAGDIDVCVPKIKMMLDEMES